MAVNVPINFLANVDDAASEFKKLTGVFKLLGAAFVADKITDGLGSIIDAAAEAEVATNSMVSAMRLAGDYSEQNARQFQKLAEEIQNTSKFDDDLIISQVAVAKQFGATNKQAEQMIRAAVELSAATGQDLNSSMQLLGKSLDGTAGKLNELVPGMRQLTAEQLAAGAAADIVLKRFGGAASAQLSTFSGAVAQAKNSFSNLLEEMGNAIVQNPAVIKAINEISGIIVELTKTVSENKQSFTILVTDGINFLVSSVGVGIQVLKILDEQLTELAIAAKYLVEPILRIPEALALMAKLDFKQLKKNTEDFEAELKSMRTELEKRAKVYDDTTLVVAKISNAIDGVKQSQSELTGEVKKTKSGFDSQGNSAKRANADLIAGIDKLKGEVKNLGETELDTIINNFNEKIDLTEKAQEYGLIGAIESEDIIKKLRMQAQKEYTAQEKKDYEERIAREEKFLSHLKEIQDNPIKVIFDQNASNSLGLSDQMREGVSAGAGVLGSVLGGKEGARNMVGNISEAMGKFFLGIPGLGEIAKVLSQGPDKVRELVREFAKALPELIKNVLLAIPVVIEELAKALPDIIEALVDAAPEIITKLIENIPRVIVALISILPRLVGPLAIKLAEGAFKFVDTILQGAVDFVGKLIQSIGDGIAKVFENLNPFKGGFNPSGGGGFGLGGDKGLLGGGIIPGFLKGGSSADGLAIPASQKGSSSGGQSSPGTATIVVQIERREIAKTIVDLNRLGYRLA
jgi:hypothetical protein